jgi:pimeloyl-ACP methyl ester carboxylesterase
MLRPTASALLLLFLATTPPWLAAQAVPPEPQRERFQNAQVIYGWAQDNQGERLRIFVTRPNGASGKAPAIFFVGWLSCDTMEYPNADTNDGFGILLRRLIEQSGYATVRMDKPGVGESVGECPKTDFTTELSGYQSAFEQMLKYDFIDPENIFVIGLSNGGGTAPLIPRQHPVRGYIAASSWGRTWYEHIARPRASSSDPRSQIASRSQYRRESFRRVLYSLPDQRHDAGRSDHPASRMEEFLVRLARRPVRAPRILLPAVASAQLRRNLAASQRTRSCDSRRRR